MGGKNAKAGRISGYSNPMNPAALPFAPFGGPGPFGGLGPFNGLGGLPFGPFGGPGLGPFNGLGGLPFGPGCGPCGPCAPALPAPCNPCGPCGIPQQLALPAPCGPCGIPQQLAPLNTPFFGAGFGAGLPFGADCAPCAAPFGAGLPFGSGLGCGLPYGDLGFGNLALGGLGGCAAPFGAPFGASFGAPFGAPFGAGLPFGSSLGCGLPYGDLGFGNLALGGLGGCAAPFGFGSPAAFGGIAPLAMPFDNLALPYNNAFNSYPFGLGGALPAATLPAQTLPPAVAAAAQLPTFSGNFGNFGNLGNFNQFANTLPPNFNVFPPNFVPQSPYFGYGGLPITGFNGFSPYACTAPFQGSNIPFRGSISPLAFPGFAGCAAGGCAGGVCPL